MRKLNFDDTFKTIEIIVRHGLDGAFSEKIKQLSSGETDELKMGMRAFMTVLASEKTREIVFEFLSLPSEMTVEEIRTLGLKDQLELLKNVYEQNDLKDFFQALVQFFNMGK